MKAFYRFLERYPTKKFQKNEIILHEDDEPKFVYAINTGFVRASTLSVNGEEKPITFYAHHDVFPIGWIFSKNQYANYYFSAFTDCEIYIVPKDDYINFLRKDTDALLRVLSYNVDRYLNNQIRIAGLEQSRASKKILFAMKYFASQYGEPANDDTTRIVLPLTQQDLASFVGLTRETTGIELKKLEKQGIISSQRQNYIVFNQKLDELIKNN